MTQFLFSIVCTLFFQHCLNKTVVVLDELDIYYVHFELVLRSLTCLVLYNSQAGWKENHATFITELKSLTATGLSSFGSSLREALDLLNIHRLHTGIDHYGQVN